MAGPPDRTAAAGRPAALLMRVLGARLRYQATRKGGTNKVSDLQQHELFTAQAEEAPGRGGRPRELAPGRHDDPGLSDSKSEGKASNLARRQAQGMSAP